MKDVSLSNNPMRRVFGATAVSATIHVFGALTCATCWTIFGPALALLFGSAGTAFLSNVRPYAPYAIGLSSIGLTYSIFQLIQTRNAATKLPYRMAAAFTALSVLGWTASAAYTIVTIVKG